MRSRVRVFAVGVMIALAAIACGGGEEPALEGSPDAAATATPQAMQQKKLAFADSSLGKILTIEGEGTVYVFLRDAGGKSACTAGCTTTWPPLEVGDGVGFGSGVDRGKVGSIQRDDGKEQVTYAGKPLYQFSGDQQPGDTKGQGIGGNWYVVGADGEPIKG